MTENKKFDLHVLVSMQIEKSLTSFTLGVFFFLLYNRVFIRHGRSQNSLASNYTEFSA